MSRDEPPRCVICALSIVEEDGGLCEEHKYDEQTAAGGSTGRVYYGQTFTAPCGNDFWDEATRRYQGCPGSVTFGPDDRQAACGTCGGQCGRLVAFGLPSGAPWRVAEQGAENPPVSERGETRACTWRGGDDGCGCCPDCPECVCTGQ